MVIQFNYLKAAKKINNKKKKIENGLDWLQITIPYCDLGQNSLT